MQATVSFAQHSCNAKHAHHIEYKSKLPRCQPTLKITLGAAKNGFARNPCKASLTSARNSIGQHAIRTLLLLFNAILQDLICGELDAQADLWRCSLSAPQL